MRHRNVPSAPDSTSRPSTNRGGGVDWIRSRQAALPRASERRGQLSPPQEQELCALGQDFTTQLAVKHVQTLGDGTWHRLQPSSCPNPNPNPIPRAATASPQTPITSSHTASQLHWILLVGPQTYQAGKAPRCAPQANGASTRPSRVVPAGLCDCSSNRQNRLAP